MKRILVVDDVTTNLICAKEILKDDYEVFTAKSGKEVLDRIHNIKPDLIFADICMPEMDGFQLYEKLRENPDYADVKIIFCTAESRKEVLKKKKELGVECIRKPFSPEILTETIKRAFEKSYEQL